MEDTRVPWPEADPRALDRDMPALSGRPPTPLPAIGEGLAVRMRRSPEGASSRERVLDYRFDILLHGAAPAVFKRIAAFHETLDDGAAASMRPAGTEPFSRAQIWTMSDSWQVACTTGSAVICGDNRHARTCAVSIQHFVERWLTERLQGPVPFAVVAAIHTPAPASPLRHWADAPVPATLLAPHLRDDASVQATLSRRAASMRALLDAGATVHACYSAASLEKMSLTERETYRSTCETYPNLLDEPSPLPPGAFNAVCGATYLFGTGPLSLTGCIALRLPQAADAEDGAAQAHLFVASPLDAPFKDLLDELKRDVGLVLDPAYGGVAVRAMVDEPDYV
ncbi:hypothetical protein [Pararobbsia alpina]|nr:hypothetical protein [Pararobbsia alpina]